MTLTFPKEGWQKHTNRKTHEQTDIAPYRLKLAKSERKYVEYDICLQMKRLDALSTLQEHCDPPWSW